MLIVLCKNRLLGLQPLLLPMSGANVVTSFAVQRFWWRTGIACVMLQACSFDTPSFSGASASHRCIGAITKQLGHYPVVGRTSNCVTAAPPPAAILPLPAATM